jgi:hypothetical protein
MWADERNRTFVSNLEGWSNNHYTTSACVGGTNLLQFCTSTIKVLLSLRPESNRVIMITSHAHRQQCLRGLIWSGKPGSNWPPQPWQGCALPNELLPRLSRFYFRVCLVFTSEFGRRWEFWNPDPLDVNQMLFLWANLLLWTLTGSNRRPNDYESFALTNWAKGPICWGRRTRTAELNERGFTVPRNCHYAIPHFYWWPRRDSNSHVFQHWFLRPTCLPFHHSAYLRPLKVSNLGPSR